MNYYLYLDSIHTNDSWFNKHLKSDEWMPFICRSYEEAIWFLNKLRGNKIIIDLDYDLGDESYSYDGFDPYCRNGYNVCEYIIVNNLSLEGFHIHTRDKDKAKKIRALMTDYGYKEIT